MRTPEIGLSERQRITSVAMLNVVDANLFVLRARTKKAHWDIVGPQFKPLHELLDSCAEQLDHFLDEGAERVRMLGAWPLGTARGFLELATLKEDPGNITDATTTLSGLVNDHEQLTRELRAGLERLDARDVGTVDHLTQLVRALEKSGWMLRAYLEGAAVQPDGGVSLPAMVSPSMA